MAVFNLHLRHTPVPNQGFLIIALQTLLLALAPVLDDGGRLTPLPYVLAVVTVSVITLLLLGYPKTAIAIAVAGVAGLSVALALRLESESSWRRIPLWLLMVVPVACSVLLCIKTAFALRMPPVQRILCGAASFVMIGYVFACVHGICDVVTDGGAYEVVAGVEHARPLRWIDFLWLSFATLTTAGFGDVAPVGGYAYAVSAIEALCGILFPCTLIARITSIPEAEAACRVEEQMAAEAETLSGQASRSTPARSSPRASC